MRHALAVHALAWAFTGCALRSTTIGEMNPTSDGSAEDAASGADDGLGATDAGTQPDAAVGDIASPVDSNLVDTGACVPPPYPSGPYGVVQGSVLAPSLTWQGYRAGSSTTSTIASSDYFADAHCRGVRALYIVELEAADPTAEAATTIIQQNLAGAWKAGTVEVLELVTRGAAGAAATPADALAWSQSHNASWSVGVDAAEAFHDGNGYYPQIRLVVDACTMRVLRWVHRDDVAPDLAQLAASAGCAP